MELGYMEDNRPSPLVRADKALGQNGIYMYMYMTLCMEYVYSTLAYIHVHLCTDEHHVYVHEWHEADILLQHHRLGRWVNCW